MSNKIQNYLDELPEDFELLLKNLVLLLRTNESLSFSELVNKSGIQKSLLSNHLNKLEISGLVQNYLKKDLTSSNYSFYELTRFGRKFINDFIASYVKFFKLHKNSEPLFIDLNQEIPEDFELLLKALKNKFRYALTQLLEKYDNLSFSDISKLTNKEAGILTSHLKKLELGGLIQNFLMKSGDTNEYSYYRLTKLGKIMIRDIINSYNNYYSGRYTELKTEGEVEERIDFRYFDVGCTTWALPNEKILGWIDLFSNDIAKLELILSNNLLINDVFNVKFEWDQSKKAVILDIAKLDITYLSFQFYSKIPDGTNSINTETIDVIAFDEELNPIYQKSLKIEILKPIVLLDVKSKQQTPISGYFEIKITILKGFQIIIPGINIEVFDENHEKVNIKTTETDPIEFMTEIPPGVKPENLIGGFKINHKGKLIFHFKVPYKDTNNNIYYSNEVKIEIQNNEQYSGNIDYVYNQPALIIES